ncbi:hypothetical protein, partial [Brevibacillus sp. 179-C9.3 HS]
MSYQEQMAFPLFLSLGDTSIGSLRLAVLPVVLHLVHYIPCPFTNQFNVVAQTDLTIKLNKITADIMIFNDPQKKMNNDLLG